MIDERCKDGHAWAVEQTQAEVVHEGNSSLGPFTTYRQTLVSATCKRCGLHQRDEVCIRKGDTIDFVAVTVELEQ